jgi:hypothetical protein
VSFIDFTPDSETTITAEQVTPYMGPPVCVCGHVLEDHEQGHGTQPCNATDACDCSEFCEQEGP